MSTIEKAVEKLGKKSQNHDSAAPSSSSPDVGGNLTSEPDSQVFFDKTVESSADAAPSASQSENKSIVLPIKELEARGFVSPYKPRSYIAEEYRAIKRPLLQNIDTNMGRLLRTIESLGLADKTLIVFSTDNGSAAGSSFYNAEMRGSKNSPYRGGTRVPAFWKWKGVLPEGVDVSQVTAHIDVLPTLCELAGVQVPEAVDEKIEGQSLVPLPPQRITG